MAKTKVEPTPFYRSALCGVGNAVQTANEWKAEGYTVKYCFPIVVEGGTPTIYMLGSK